VRNANADHGLAIRHESSELVAAIQPAKEAAAKLNRRAGRFDIYDYLETIYRIYRRWRYRKIAKRLSHTLAAELAIVRRKGTNPIRILIEATLPNAALKRKSRWVRALEYVSSEHVPPSQFRRFIRTHGGLAGCARLAVQAKRRRRRSGGDWAD
jgi:hypothetical protein